MGPPCAGKSYFIRHNFPDFTVVDLFDFQEGIGSDKEAIMQSYEDTKNALIDSLKKNNDTVLEHTLLKAIRRRAYIDAVRENSQSPIDVYVIVPDYEEWKRNSDLRGCWSFQEMYEGYIKTLEMPTQEEGFANIYVVKGNDITKIE